MLCTQRENGRRVPPEGVLARTPAPAGGAWRPWDSSHAALGRAPPRPQCPVVCQDLVLFLFPGAGGGAASGTPRSPTRVSNDENEPLLNTLMLRARVQARETHEAESLPRVRETVARQLHPQVRAQEKRRRFQEEKARAPAFTAAPRAGAGGRGDQKPAECRTPVAEAPTSWDSVLPKRPERAAEEVGRRPGRGAGRPRGRAVTAKGTKGSRAGCGGGRTSVEMLTPLNCTLRKSRLCSTRTTSQESG